MNPKIGDIVFAFRTLATYVDVPCKECDGTGTVRKFYLKKRCMYCLGRGYNTDSVPPHIVITSGPHTIIQERIPAYMKEIHFCAKPKFEGFTEWSAPKERLRYTELEAYIAGIIEAKERDHELHQRNR